MLMVENVGLSMHLRISFLFEKKNKIKKYIYEEYAKVLNKCWIVLEILPVGLNNSEGL